MNGTYEELVIQDLSRRGAPSPEKYMAQQEHKLNVDYAHWNKMMEYGCSDPFWSDGVNMNLTRNHIIAYKNMMSAIHRLYGIQLPAGYYLPTPPEVSNHYMASGPLPESADHEKARRERMKKELGRTVTIRKARTDTEIQLTFI